MHYRFMERSNMRHRFLPVIFAQHYCSAIRNTLVVGTIMMIHLEPLNFLSRGTLI